MTVLNMKASWLFTSVIFFARIQDGIFNLRSISNAGYSKFNHTKNQNVANYFSEISFTFVT